MIDNAAGQDALEPVNRERFDARYFKTQYGELSAKSPHNYRERYWARRLPRDGLVLEIGPGLGGLAPVARNCRQLVPVDISPFAIARTSAGSGRSGIVASADALPIPSGLASMVVAMDVLEHLPSPADALMDIARCIKAGGHLVMSVPNTEGYGARRKRQRGTWFGDRDPTHMALLSPRTWVSLVERAGFRIDRLGTDLLWDAPYWSWVPSRAQRLLLSAVNAAVVRSIGMVRGQFGENVLVLATRLHPDEPPPVT